MSQNDLSQNIGTLLKEERIRQSLQIEDVSNVLKLGTNKIRAIEQGDYSLFREAIFLKAFIKSYGRFLKIEQEINPLVEQLFNDTIPKVGLSSTVNNNYKKFNYMKIKDTFKRKLLTIIVIVLLIMVCVYFWQAKSTQQLELQAQNQLKIVEPIEPSLDIPNANIVVVPLDKIKNDIQIASDIQDEKQNLYTSSSLSTANKILIHIKYRSKLTVVDGEGNELINQIVPGGSQHEFSGGIPFNIRVGYAKGSTIEYQDTTVDLDKYMINQSATIKIPL